MASPLQLILDLNGLQQRLQQIKVKYCSCLSGIPVLGFGLTDLIDFILFIKFCTVLTDTDMLFLVYLHAYCIAVIILNLMTNFIKQLKTYRKRTFYSTLGTRSHPQVKGHQHLVILMLSWWLPCFHWIRASLQKPLISILSTRICNRVVIYWFKIQGAFYPMVTSYSTLLYLETQVTWAWVYGIMDCCPELSYTIQCMYTVVWCMWLV